jgi:hypothetical protein
MKMVIAIVLSNLLLLISIHSAFSDETRIQSPSKEFLGSWTCVMISTDGGKNFKDAGIAFCKVSENRVALVTGHVYNIIECYSVSGEDGRISNKLLLRDGDEENWGIAPLSKTVGKYQLYVLFILNKDLQEITRMIIVIEPAGVP